MNHFGEASKGPRGFVQRKAFDDILTGDQVVSHWRWGTRLKNKIFGVCTGRWSKCGVIHSRLNESINSTYVIERPFSFTLIINDMKRILKKVFKSKKPSLGSIHGLVPATSTSTSTGSGATDLMLSVPACDSGTTSAQVAAGIVSVQFRPSHLWVLTYCY